MLGMVSRKLLGLLQLNIMLEQLLAENNDDDNASSSQSSSDQELALSKAVDVMSQNMETATVSFQSKKEKHKEYEYECREKLSNNEVQSDNEAAKELLETAQESREKLSSAQVELNSDVAKESVETLKERDGVLVGVSGVDEKPIEEEKMLSYPRKIAVLYEILSGCLADKREDNNKKYTRRRKGYDARHRVALRLLATWLDIKWIQMEAIETIIACSAMAVAKEEESKEEASHSTKSKWAKWKRGGIIGAAAITGGTLLAITGGLAAPAIAAGFGALAPTLGTLIPVIGASGFAAAASAAGTVAGSVAVAASFGAAGAGLAGTKMARRTGNVDEFEFKAIGENHNQGRLAVEILVSGFVFDEEDFIRPWEGQIDNLERYVLQWESKNLIAVSTAIQDWLTSSIALGLMKQGAMMTVLSTLLAALAWPATLLAATDFIDSRWSVAIDRSDKAGKLLAEVLLKGLQGNRPVTLVGYSLGARVIFKCLETLAETERNAEVVERVVLLGAPISIKNEKWAAARKVVAGRFVNAYSTNDWILGVAFRASLLTQGLAGIQPIDVPGIENIDVTDIIEGHSSYLWATQKVLDKLELDAYYPVFRSSVHYE
ncbi:transmembrane and coiled-coil domain-containing protein 4 isoform X3 [Ricinus communis]|uniref:transmembrane and coiled-coil domain-containing protein 4 isoform X3 n=1 Tax=Ricinus communis TaxID=3988 RepID=UPI00077290AA|nr:transmembrane and coiled-coil domain-containing protein 4 isoform X3 [Ricinus communis]|eukprot:XP_015583614.1 transmembrane and coiled-coil domain-containing protein 4 isoform X2 [Ricinus communis]